MDQQQWKQINSIVDTALDLDKNKREDYIEEQCGKNQELKTQVAKLLESIEKSDTEDFLESPESYPKNLIADLANRSDTLQDKPALVGKTIHQYKITKLIGHGGMGSVFLAKRADDAFKQKVALKILRYGMDTPTNIARFKRERHILAKLDHPNIARLLDGGVTNDGLPYLVMEYVEGTPLISFCDKNRLSVKERLELFKSVCKAVQHAHNNAIIHRDLKPSNILVTEERQVKILDFGIAKLLEPEDPDTKLFETRTGARILTLGYAAPEQINNEHITTATDGYTLGLLLYELLAGASPFEMGANLSDVEQYITEKTPPKPSARFSALNSDKQHSIARNRKESAEKLIQILRGDLDAIIMKTLRKEPKRRYEAVNQMMEDLERRELNHPIIAREDTFRYKASKFLKRYKTGLSTVTAVIILITTIIFYYSWQITEERNRAQHVSAFLTDMFRAGNPRYNPQDTLTVAGLLQRGQKRIDQLNNQPEIQEQLLSVIGEAYLEIGKSEEAKFLIEQSLDLREEIYGSSSVEFAKGISGYGGLHRQMGNFNKAESLRRKALPLLKSHLGNDHTMIVETLSGLGLVLNLQGEYQEADSVLKKALQISRDARDIDPLDKASTLNNRATVLRHLGNREEAEQLYRQALSIYKNQHGDIHPSTAQGYHDLALSVQEQGEIKLADSLYHKALRIDKQLYDSPHPDIAQFLNNIGLMYGQQGRYKEAEPYLTEALNMRRQLLDKEHPRLAESLNNLARLYIEMGENDKARPLLKKALVIDRKEHGENHPYVGIDLSNLARIEKNDGSYARAEQYLQKSLSIFKQALPPGNRRIGMVLTELGEINSLQNRPEEAIPLLRSALKSKKQSYKEGSWQIAYTQMILGKVLINVENYNEAEEQLTQGYQILQKERDDSDKYIQQARKYLVDLYKAWGKPELANQYGS